MAAGDRRVVRGERAPGVAAPLGRPRPVHDDGSGGPMSVWDEAKHHRADAGTSTGGQFISYNAGKRTGTGYREKGGDARVKRLQRALNALGYRDAKGHRLDVDGMLGPLTTQSVKAAQRKLGIPVDGKVSPGLLRRLEGAAGRKGRSSDASKAADAVIRRKASKAAAKHTAAKTAVARAHNAGRQPRAKATTVTPTSNIRDTRRTGRRT